MVTIVLWWKYNYFYFVDGEFRYGGNFLVGGFLVGLEGEFVLGYLF